MLEQLHQIFLKSNGVNTDTRSIEKDQLFFALTGDNFDGNQYIEQALNNGAIHAISSDTKWSTNPKVTVVKNTLTTLQELATFHRNQLNIPIIALTGSNGKTTTKELILSVLANQFKVKGTKGNLNNHIGVPLTLLSFDSSLQIGIVELGANHPKEIAALCDIAQPNIGLITNYGKAHLEGFGSIEGVKNSKSELYNYLKETNGKVIVSKWDPEQIVRTVGMNQFFTPSNTSIHSNTPYIQFIAEGNLIKTQLTGVYNYHNALFAYTVGKLMEMQTEQIVSGIENYAPKNNRSQIIIKNKTKIILDAYNANPSSMKVALENLASQNYTNKIAILGDMFELGAYAAEEHQNIASLTQKLKINDVYLIGENFFKSEVKSAIQFEDLTNFLEKTDLNTDTEQVILIKGSRGMSLEKILESKTLKN
ncbi:UDP-N-acetylmuramoyl-tripeptide--D-alanyl-D-alanine ligase [Nonlabens xylanidelens]|uniref:UDP-N-acetylmuramoyl-tripeptide--D-alanyl-D-alanine ligase n=1 Tax=Nonlabens xylanidelens TaxID=191564 RepID=A0A2S6IS78_9FLAO|nr:UDP-N-acetylmuramoyl-tripeptide--D-alanyl-D-alanine ligase [Nonlabens xylanidelens]PPK97122.1 UDP-N-acetylmuramoyl-tripeptide--D-alanyl-D-alanine ligase [Nonlabens xylanidelens]PQJ13805.1 UDP-N-acetylmuramoyl-tripeptide--D-alanyl-D-alanine ligase [Nonlabens xylanidelens]